VQASIRQRLIIIFVCLAVLPLLAVGAFIAWRGFTSMTEEALAARRQLARGVAAMAEEYLGDLDHELDLAGRLLSRDANGDGLARASLEPLFGAGVFDELTLFDPAGAMLAHFGQNARQPLAPGHAAAYLKAHGACIDSGDLSVEVLFPGSGSAFWLLVARPVYRPNGQLAAVLVAEASLARMSRILDTLRLAPGEQVYVVSADGRLMAAPDMDESQAGLRMSLPAADGPARGRHGQEALVAMVPFSFAGQSFTAVTEISLSEALASAWGMVTVVALVVLLALAVAAWLANATGAGIVAPVMGLAYAARQAAGGDLSVRADVAGDKELRLLATTFNDMAARLEAGMKSLTGRMEEARRLAAELSVSEATARSLINANRDTALLLARDLTILDLNEEAAAYFGQERVGLVGRNLREVMGPDAYEARLGRRLEGVLAGRRQRYEITLDGRILDVLLTPVSGDEGKVEKIAAFAADVTERRTAEARLRENEERFRTVADFTHDWEYWLGPDGTFLYVSPSCERMTGYGAEMFMVSPGLILDIVRDEDRERIRAHLFGEERREERVQLEFGIVTRDGRELAVSHVCQPVFDAAGAYRGRRGSNRDVTDERRLREDLIQARLSAEEASRAKSMFLANMSHELRTPLSGIMGLSELLLLGDGVGARERGYLELIRESGRSLLAIVDDILDVTRIEAGKLQITPRDFDLPARLRAVTAAFAPQAQAKGLDLELSVAPEVPACVHGDPERLAQILNNLLANAVKFTARGRIGLEVRPDGAGQDGPRLVFSVTDSGVGIAPEDLAHLFEAFYQADASYAKRFGGMGLGLAIVRHLCDLLGGSVAVVSRVGEGSTFRVVLPFGPAGNGAQDASVVPLRPVS